ncbi:MAG: hypothetical protein GC162_06540 [Planctomycetes bacterium]|nr:hypothetical protein [Planctomycetota bacterium]
MASIWQAPEEIRRQVNELKEEHHVHLAMAGVWVLCSDGKSVRDNHIVVTQTKKCTQTEKLSTGNDFKIVIMMEAWATMPDAAREIALDEALCRCGVRYVPQTMEINGKKEVVKDELGRVVYTGEIDYDKEGNPRWKVNPPDAGLYYKLLQRRGKYNEEADNVTRALADKPLKNIVVAPAADMITSEIA